MGTKTIVFGSLVVLICILYQLVLKDVIFILYGFGRTHQKIEDFPYKCHRLESPLLESCEDMVLDTAGRRLYASCSSMPNRVAWSPGGSAFNTCGRELKDHVSVLNIDKPGKDGLYGLHTLDITSNYKSATGGKEIDIHGIDMEVLSKSRLRFFIINHRPPIDEEGNHLDAKKLGANSTIEVFEHDRGSPKLEHIRTLFSDAVSSPNNLVAAGDGGVFVTNDHTSKAGRFRELELVFGGGSVTYCAPNGTCTSVASSQFKYANGIIKDRNNLIYVVSSANGRISVFSLRSNNTLLKIDQININMPMDNLSIDSNGDIFAAGFPNIFALGKALHEPLTTNVPSTVFRIRSSVDRDGKRSFEYEKVLEDVEGTLLHGATVAVRDTKTGTIWLGGVMSPFITVCEKQRTVGI